MALERTLWIAAENLAVTILAAKRLAFADWKRILAF